MEKTALDEVLHSTVETPQEVAICVKASKLFTNTECFALSNLWNSRNIRGYGQL
jgi:hypothetical protein